MKISQLPEATKLTEGDQIPLLQDGVTKRIDSSLIGGNDGMGMTEGVPWWGNGALGDVTWENYSREAGGVGMELCPGPYHNTPKQTGLDNDLGIFMFTNLTIKGTVNLIGDFQILMATESIVVDGTLKISRGGGFSGKYIPGFLHDPSAPGHSIHANSPIRANSCSTGGGGGGGSGNSCNQSGYWGDHLLNPQTGASLASGGSGGGTRCNAMGYAGGAGATSGNNATFRSVVNSSLWNWNVPRANVTGGTVTTPWLGAYNTSPMVGGGVDVSFPVIMGGNGGPGGASTDYPGAYWGGGGGMGGGCLMLVAPTIIINGMVRADGNQGQSTRSPHHFASGSGGGGGGGMIAFVFGDANTSNIPHNKYSVNPGDRSPVMGNSPWGAYGTFGNKGSHGSMIMRQVTPDGTLTIHH